MYWAHSTPPPMLAPLLPETTLMMIAELASFFARFQIIPQVRMQYLETLPSLTAVPLLLCLCPLDIKLFLPLECGHVVACFTLHLNRLLVLPASVYQFPFLRLSQTGHGCVGFTFCLPLQSDSQDGPALWLLPLPPSLHKLIAVVHPTSWCPSPVFSHLMASPKL